MKLVHIQQALFAAYDLRNAMTSADMKRPTEGESMGACLTEVIEFLEGLEADTEQSLGLDENLDIALDHISHINEQEVFNQGERE